MTATTVTRGAARAPLIAPRRGAPPRRAHLRVVESSTRSARRTRRRIAFAVSVTVLAVLTVVVFHVLLAQSQVRLDDLERRSADAEARYQQARLVHDGLTAPPRIVQQATEIGLVLPNQPPTAVTVPAGDVPARRGTSGTIKGAQDVKRTLADQTVP